MRSRNFIEAAQWLLSARKQFDLGWDTIDKAYLMLYTYIDKRPNSNHMLVSVTSLWVAIKLVEVQIVRVIMISNFSGIPTFEIKAFEWKLLALLKYDFSGMTSFERMCQTNVTSACNILKKGITRGRRIRFTDFVRLPYKK